MRTEAFSCASIADRKDVRAFSKESRRTDSLKFAINSGVKQTSTYSYDNDVNDGNGQALCYKYNSGEDTGYGYIKFPVVEGKYLQSVALVHRTPVSEDATGNDLKGFYFTLQKGGFPSSTSTCFTSSRVKAGEELLMSFPLGSFTSELGQYNVLYLTTLISINLGVMNLLPIPALDGGHLLIYAVEVVRRKPMNEKLEGLINAVGLLLMLGLAVVIAIKDIITL